MKIQNITIQKNEIAEFCKKNHILKLSLFGSILRDDFKDDSDIDTLVEFEQGNAIGFIRLAGMEIELSEMLGRKVDFRTPNDLSPYFRGKVVGEAMTLYARG